MAENLSIPTSSQPLHAVSKEYVYTKEKTITLTVSGWSGSGPYAQTIAVDGMADGRRVMVYLTVTM